ncbi:DUF788-domain-containing protein [Fistulina hepatica ATCC 64428]|uniref:DUF788-domain-containing protein n=1 Tax=Fistulina hepatica ATCC 64428 TaxID=1128425 RepID=A0A0D7A4V7_9AGAR|nr:DUF788-domain-containing protein [Fistulina hepatica ATCC 64428]
MANASAKRIAKQNESTVKMLRLGMFLPSILSLVLRLLFRSGSLLPSNWSILLYICTFCPAFFLSKYLIKVGTTHRDPTTGTLISFGEDLSQPGVTESCFDIIYITWICQVGSGIFGDWFWWLYLIPLYAVFKLWTSAVSPLLFGRSSMTNPVDGSDSANNPPVGTSKRQEKLKKRQERGDPRVKAQQVKRS